MGSGGKRGVGFRGYAARNVPAWDFSEAQEGGFKVPVRLLRVARDLQVPAGRRRESPETAGLPSRRQAGGLELSQGRGGRPLGKTRDVFYRLEGASSSRLADRWRNDKFRPVLKHGPRSLTWMRVLGRETRGRNESEERWEAGGFPLAAPSAGSPAGGVEQEHL